MAKMVKKAQNGILGGIKKKASEIKAKYNAFNKSIDDDAAYSKKTFKTADSLKNANPKVGPKGLKGMLDEKASNRRKADSLVKTVEKRVGVPRELNMYDNKNGGKTKKKYKHGGTVSMQLGSYTRQIGKNYTGKKVVNKGAKAKMGKSVGKCKNGC